MLRKSFRRHGNAQRRWSNTEPCQHVPAPTHKSSPPSHSSYTMKLSSHYHVWHRIRDKFGFSHHKQGSILDAIILQVERQGFDIREWYWAQTCHQHDFTKVWIWPKWCCWQPPGYLTGMHSETNNSHWIISSCKTHGWHQSHQHCLYSSSTWEYVSSGRAAPT